MQSIVATYGGNPDFSGSDDRASPNVAECAARHEYHGEFVPGPVGVKGQDR